MCSLQRVVEFEFESPVGESGGQCPGGAPLDERVVAVQYQRGVPGVDRPGLAGAAGDVGAVQQIFPDQHACQLTQIEGIPPWNTIGVAHRPRRAIDLRLRADEPTEEPPPRT